jgi:FkbM family methyltransferase
MNQKMLFLLRKATLKIKLFPGAVLALNLIRQYFFKKPFSVRIDNFDGDLTIDLRLNEHMQSQIFWYGYYSRDILLVLRRLLKPGMTVIDAGANIGEITLVAAKMVGASGHVYAFEPLPEIASKLSQNVSLNNFTQVFIHEKGLSDEPGDKEIYRASSDFHDGSKHEGLATLYPSEQRGEKAGVISLVTLDDFCEQAEIKQLDLIKMDIEGAELPALKGGIETLRRFMPYIIIEVQQETTSQAGYNAADILALLEPLGYRFDIIGRKGQLYPVVATSLGRFQNILCSPLGRE